MLRTDGVRSSKAIFLASVTYHISLPMVLRARAFDARRSKRGAQKALDPKKSNMATMEVCSPYKTVPQSMINSVLAVCPNADPKNVAKDLVITGSPTRTINRILDRQVSMKTNARLRTRLVRRKSL